MKWDIPDVTIDHIYITHRDPGPLLLTWFNFDPSMDIGIDTNIEVFLFYHDETKWMMNKRILSIQMLKFVPKLSLVTAWLHVHILRSCDMIVSPW